MKDLFYKAREFGQVSIHTHDDGEYSCNIKFNTITHVELIARSGYGHKTVERSISAAISNAEKIVQSMVKETENLKRLTGGKS